MYVNASPRLPFLTEFELDKRIFVCTRKVSAILLQITERKSTVDHQSTKRYLSYNPFLSYSTHNTEKTMTDPNMRAMDIMSRRLAEFKLLVTTKMEKTRFE